MKFEKKIITLLTTVMLLSSTFAVLSQNFIPAVNSAYTAKLTGNIYDSGRDVDNDTKYDFLDVAVGVNVYSEGYYQVQVSDLLDPKNSSYYYPRNSYKHLSVGTQLLNLSFYGPELHAANFNVSAIGNIRLLDYYWNQIDYLPYARLSRTYYYTEFDCLAVFTGRIFDEGIDTDGDGLFNKLQIGVEINVTDAAMYGLSVSNLYGTVSVNVYNYSFSFLNAGVQIVNATLDGAEIYMSHGNVSGVESISLYTYDGYSFAHLNRHPLSKTYSYNEFDTLAFLTGAVWDNAVDEDSDGLFDYLEINVEVNVTDAGYYLITLENLYGNDSDFVYLQMSSVSQSFDVGIHNVSFTVYGPRIYALHINPSYVGPVKLYYHATMEEILLEGRPKMALSVPYHYYEFESHAFLTGKVYDQGVDADDDGLFDYLKVGVEVNVTEAGRYGLSVGGLAQIVVGWGVSQISYYQYSENDLSQGIHVINFTFPGSMIVYCNINPTHVTDLGLAQISPYCQLTYIKDVPLSKMYNYTEFNSPLTSMQVEFTVYPNATIGISGSANQTHYYAPSYYPAKTNATLGFSTSGNVTTGSVNGTTILPEYPPSLRQFPFNSTSANFSYKLYHDMLNAQLNATVNLPPEGKTTYPYNSSDFSFESTYSNGTLNVDLYGETELPSFIISQFPFNLTDSTVIADYKNNEINGSITFHTISGFPLGDVIVYFNGNKTELSFTGYINVIYGDYFGMKINETVLDEMLSQLNSTIPGRGPQSLYNMTQGIVECTKLNMTKTPITVPLEGARIDYNATINGNFTKLIGTIIAKMLSGYWTTGDPGPFVCAALDATLSSVDHASLTLNYYKSGIASLHLTLSDDVKALWGNALKLIPPTVPALFLSMPPEYVPYYINLTKAYLKIANVTAYAVENADMYVDYSSATQQLNVRTSLTVNETRIKNESISILPDIVPSQYRELVKSYTNTTYCTLDSLNITCNYVNGVTSFDAKWLLKGDFTAELNRIKHYYVNMLNLTSPYMINLQMLVLNSTEIDISNFKLDIRQGKDWMTLTFEGLKIHPAKDKLDLVRFKLHNLITAISSSFGSPREFEKLKIIITAGTNATHTVLLYAPYGVPNPDKFSLDYKSMTWENTSFSSLKDLVFHIAYQEVVDYLAKTYYVPLFTNSTVSNFNFDPSAKRISFNATGATGTGFCNITIPRSLLYAAIGNWTVKIDGTSLSAENFTVTQNDEYVFIYFNYTHSSHTIEIVGTWVVTEFPPNMLPPILTILSLIVAIIAVKKRKRLGTLKTKYQNSIRSFAKTLHQLRT